MSEKTEADKLTEISDLANEAGAQGIFFIRGAKNAHLIYYLNPSENCPYCGSDDIIDFFDPIENVIDRFKCKKCNQIWENTPIALKLADAGVLLIARFPAGDGGESGVESR